jgi:hypothetical protein
MRAPVAPNTISGLIFVPLVSSSKNLSNPALEAGKGAFFFLLMTNQYVVQALNRLRSMFAPIIFILQLNYSIFKTIQVMHKGRIYGIAGFSVNEIF